MSTKQQKLATIAFEQVNQVAEQHKEGSSFRQKYGSMSHKLPILILKDGPAQAFAFMLAKKEKAYIELLNHLAEAIEWPNVEKDGKKLAEMSRSESTDGYILLTRQILAALIWYKRFAESILDVDAKASLPEGGD